MKLKLRSTTPLLKKVATKTTLVVVAVLMVLAVPISVYADRFDDQINAIQNEVNSYQAEAARLRGEADTLQNAVNVLSAQKNAIQAEIDLNQAKYDQLVIDITANTQKLERQKTTLSKTIAQIYANGTTTPIVMIASSKSVGEYVAAQEVRNSIKNQLKSAMDEVKRLKKELETQKAEVEHILADQKSRRDDLAAKEAEQANLLAQTQGQEAAYQSLIGAKNTEISGLRAQQRAANAALGGRAVAGDPNKGGYPAYLANAPHDALVDPWGMYNRECVSYTAWKVEQKNGYMPYWGGHGNANQWPQSAINDGIPTGSEPRKNSVAISMNGYYGHAMWVEQVSGNQIYVSQYNYDLAGSYSEMWINGSGLIYIYF
jgi:peptidoglycan hydrolase CwlO-like protein